MNKFYKSVLGQSIGDALGVPFEFKKRDTFFCTDMVGYGTWNKPKGTYSDDTAMLLCTLNALGSKNFIDKVIFNFIKWKTDGFMSVNNDTFDIGNTTLNALNNHINNKPIKSDIMTNGNGSLMRIIPLALWLKTFNKEERDIIIANISSITHPHEISINCCIEAIEVAISLISGKSLFDSIPNSTNVVNIHRKEIKSDSYVKNTLTAAYWCLLNTNNYKDAVLKAVNLGEDTDTTAAIVGAFAGIIYDIPSDWIENIKNLKTIHSQIHQAQKQIPLTDLQ